MYPDGTLADFRVGTDLYRASPAGTVEQHPAPRLCNDTGKTGVYFTNNHPFLSECMAIEYDKDMDVAHYIITEPFTVEYGKYNFRRGRDLHHPSLSPVQPIDNISHFDMDVGPREDVAKGDPLHTYPDEPYGELFLSKDSGHLDKIRFVSSYRITPFQARSRWVKQPRSVQQRLRHMCDIS
jgi:hypothetical protein